ncbi:hypothetical protein AZE42_02774 [Rhizopogon vesiculosus]|uniref:Uncharacterized protein n=1 Tax=Rhizopogon vesiculosus TaxID=180088 RepID=A0A1J8QKM7_9AGAM|nr:hypothetical protein AZE42_02774 [Rhizopogon vesiculosus]
MAKQKHPYASPRSRSQQRRQPYPSPSLVCPSSSVLSILATIAASTHVVDGSPLPLPTPSPPSFLCPFIEHESFQARTPPTTASSSGFYPIYSSLSSASPTSTSSKSGRPVADKYIQGDDGRWRKTDEWTLFGSTCCSASPDIVVQTAQTSAPVSTAQSQELDSVLPAGWTSSTSSTNETDSIIILSLAIVLAVSICFFMVGCIIWRKRRKKRSTREKKMNDVELKTRHKADVDDPSEDGDKEKEARGKLRVWAKASARWKDNIRHSARRRKNRRHAFPTGRLSRPQSPILREVSISPSPPSSRRHSIVSSCEDSHVATIHSPENSPTPTQPLPTSVPSSPGIVSSPPAYMSPTSQMRPVTEDYPQEASHVNPDGATSRRESLLFGRHDFPPAPEDDDIPYQPSYAGHIAVDDKAHLARMAGLASAPPANEEGPGESSIQVPESAPAWHEDLEEFQFHPGTAATPATSPFEVGISSLPTPPSKSLLSFRYFDGHSCLEDITALDPIVSMPPYEEGPSILPFEEVLHASAPPLSNGDQAFDHWESGASESSDANGECDTPIPSSPPQPILSRPLSASSYQPSAPPDQASVGRGGALPIYRP